MKVLMVGPSRNSMGGIATVISNFYQYFRNDDVEIKYLETWREGGIISRLYLGLKSIVSLIKYILIDKIDLVHIHVAQKGSFYRKSLLILIAKVLNKKVLLHIHASQFDVFYNNSNILNKGYIKYILGLSDKIVVLSEEWKKIISGITNNKEISIVHNAVLVGDYMYNNEGVNLTFLGRLGERKGIYDLLRILEELFEKNHQFKLFLCGDGDIDKVKEIIKNKKMDNNVIVTGWISSEEKEKILKNTIINILPSYNEGMPMAILETMARGIPNISTTVGGIPQVINNMENGITNSPGDIDSLLKSITYLIENKEQRLKMSKKAYEEIKSKYSIDAYNEVFYCLYKKMIRG